MPKRRANEQSHAEPEAVQLVFDFDSTIVAVEGLDELARLALADDPARERTVEAIEAITRDGMSGAIGIDESLRRRLAMLTIERRHVDAAVGGGGGRAAPPAAPPPPPRRSAAT
jgi:hypothetical protein